MASGLVRAAAWVWTIAAVFLGVSLVLQLSGGASGIGLWISVALLIAWVASAASYWILVWRQSRAQQPAKRTVHPSDAR